MATYVLIHGAGSDSWYWHLVAPELRRPWSRRRRRWTCRATTTPPGCRSTSTPSSTRSATARDLVLVAQSLGGFTAPLVCERVPVDLMVLVAAMVPCAGRVARRLVGQHRLGAGEARAGRRDGRDDTDDPVTLFLHDLPPDVTAAAMTTRRGTSRAHRSRSRGRSRRGPTCRREFLLCRDDRFFPAEFQRRVVAERLGITPDEMDGGHLPALAHPDELVERLEAYRVAHETAKGATR